MDDGSKPPVSSTVAEGITVLEITMTSAEFDVAKPVNSASAALGTPDYPNSRFGLDLARRLHVCYAVQSRLHLILFLKRLK